MNESIKPSFATALLKAQAAIASLAEDAENTFAGFRYVSSERVIEAAKAVLNDAGIVVWRSGYDYTQPNEQGEGVLQSEYLVVHIESNEARLINQSFPYVTGKGKPIDKAVATALTTGLAYFLRDLLMISRNGSTDDMNERPDEGPRPGAVISPDQWVDLSDMIKETMTDEALFLKHFSISKLTELPAIKYEQARGMLIAKRERLQKQ